MVDAAAFQDPVAVKVKEPLAGGRSINADFVVRVGAGADKGRRDGLIGGQSYGAIRSSTATRAAPTAKRISRSRSRPKSDRTAEGHRVCAGAAAGHSTRGTIYRPIAVGRYG